MLKCSMILIVYRGVVQFAEENGYIVALTSEKVYALQMKDGSQVWEVELSNR